MNSTLVPTEIPSRPMEGIQWYTWRYKIKKWLSLGFAHAVCLSVASACIFSFAMDVLIQFKNTKHYFFGYGVMGITSALGKLLQRLDQREFWTIFL